MDEKTGLVSIIMAAYNAEKTIRKAIGSVLDQSYQEWELIVVDDCSTDGTSLIVEQIRAQEQRVRYLRNETNSGVSKSRKRGLEAAQGEWIAVLDSDDAWTTDKLEKQIRLTKEKEAQLVFTGSAFMDDNGESIDWQLHVPAVLTYRELLKQNLISNSSVLLKKKLYEENYVVGDQMHEDFAIWLLITRSGVPAYGIDEPLLIYRLANSSKSSNKFKAAKMNWKTYRHIGLNLVSASYYMCWYTIKGLLKYRHLK